MVLASPVNNSNKRGLGDFPLVKVIPPPPPPQSTFVQRYTVRQKNACIQLLPSTFEILVAWLPVSLIMMIRDAHLATLSSWIGVGLGLLKIANQPTFCMADLQTSGPLISGTCCIIAVGLGITNVFCLVVNFTSSIVIERDIAVS